MNTSNLARTTFVLDRSTHEELGDLAEWMGVSRSELVRRVLSEPVRFMHAQMARIPRGGFSDTAEVEAFGEQLGMEFGGLVDKLLADAGGVVQ